MESNNRRRKGKSAAAAPRRRVKAPGQLIPHPPAIPSYGITHSTRLRFITNAAQQQTSITFQNLLDTINVALTTVTAADLFQAVRVREVEMWATPVVGGATSVQVEFNGSVAGIIGDTVIHTDTSMGIEPAHVRARPAARSGVALFQASVADQAFALTCPSGTVVDISLTFRGRPDVFAPTQNAPVGATAGAWYYRGLDGLAAGATQFLPVVNTTGFD